MLIVVSGTPFFVGSRIVFPAFYLFVLISFLIKRWKIELFAWGFFALFLFVSISQMIYFNHFAGYATIALFIKLTFPYFIFKLIKFNVIGRYINIIYRIAIITFVMHIIFVAVPPLQSFTMEKIAPFFQVSTRNEFMTFAPNIIIYTFTPSNLLRNAGIFWEPGGYAIFLLLALMLNLKIQPKILSPKNIIFIISILSTFSTAGYIILLIVLAFHMIRQRKIAVILISLPLIIGISIYSFYTLDFLGDKIFGQIETAESVDNDETARTRFVSAKLDWEDIKGFPIIGRGRDEETRFDTYKGETTYLEHRNNGITGIAATYGLIIFFIYFFAVNKGFTMLNKGNKLFGFIDTLIFTLLGFSQGIFDKPLLIMFVFIYFATYKEKLFLIKPQRKKNEGSVALNLS